MKKILVDGGSGYIGIILCNYLLNLNYKVRVLDNLLKGGDPLISLISHPNFEFIKGDIRKYGDCEKSIDGVDAICHLAAIVGEPSAKEDPELAYSTNVFGTENIVKARNKINPNIPIVYNSTGSVYGIVEQICTEESPTNTDTVYGLTKLEAEKIVTQTDNTISLRLATAFGSSLQMRVNLLINDLVFQAVTNKHLVLFEPDARRTFVHVKDIAITIEKCLVKLFSKENKYNLYNYGSNDLNYTKRQIAEIIKEKTGCLVLYGEFAKDPDKRDYEVDYSRAVNEGLVTTIGMNEGIDELIRTVPLLKIIKQYS